MTDNENLQPQDDARTMRAHAGEALTDSRNWPGYLLIGTGIAVLGLFLVAAGYGFTGWAWIAAIVCSLCVLTGVTLVLLEHRRVKRLDDEDLMDQEGH